jgi:hypothetical protein
MRYVIIIFFLCLCSSAIQGQSVSHQYSDLKSRIELKQQEFGKLWAAASDTTKGSLIISAREYLLTTIIDSIFVLWYGTPWDFYGATTTPRQGKIACGYFITAVLSDAGLRIPRKKWAEVASEIMIKSATADIKRFSKRPVEEVETYIHKQGQGLYIVGLDCHVGFIVNYKGEIRFVHSNYYHPEIGVMPEKIKGENPLDDSKYRIVGKILDNRMVKKWICGENID